MKENYYSKEFYDGINFVTYTKNVCPLCEYATFDKEEQDGVIRNYEYKAYKTKDNTVLLSIEVPLLFPEQIGFQESVCPACTKDMISIVVEVKPHSDSSINMFDVLKQLSSDNVLKLLPYGPTSEFLRILSDSLQQQEEQA